MKSSPVHGLPRNSGSPLHSIRDKRENKEAVNLFDFKDIEAKPFEEEVLKEIEHRTNSRLSAYDNAEFPDADDLSKSYHSFSYGAQNSSLSVHQGPAHHSMNASWQFYNFVGEENSSDTTFNGTSKKPSQAIITINARTSLILVANETACSMFGYMEEEMCNGMKMSQLFTMDDGIKQNVLIEQNIDTDGNIVMASGKVLEAVDARGKTFVVSVWMKRIQAGKDPRCIVVMEPVEVTRASFLFNAEGTIEDCDFTFALLHGYEDTQDVIGLNIKKITPALVLPTPGAPLGKDIRKQRVTSRTKDLVPFPSTVKVKVHDPDFHQLYMERTPTSKLLPAKFLYKGFMWVFANVSGLVTVSKSGLVTSCNENFLRVFLGYFEAELMDKSITTLIPYFYEQIDMLCDESLHARFSGTNTSLVKDLNPPPEPNTDADATASLENSANSASSASTVEENEQFVRERIENEASEIANDSGIDTSCKIGEKCDNFHSSDAVNLSSDLALTKNEKDAVFTMGSGKKATIENTSLMKIESLDGFSPHVESSTPKQFSGSTPGLTHPNKSSPIDPPERQRLDFQDEKEHSDIINSLQQETKGDGNNTETENNIHDIKSGAEFQNDRLNSGLNTLPESFVSKDSTSDNTGKKHIKQIMTDDHFVPSEEKQETSKVVTDEDIKTNVKTSDYESLGCSLTDDSVTTASCKTADQSTDSKSVMATCEKQKMLNSSVEASVFEKASYTRCDSSVNRILPGQYYGQARHKDGSMLPILFEIKALTGKKNEPMFCVWISRDLDEEAECNMASEQQQQLLASFNTTVNTSVGNFQEMLKDMQELKVEDPGSGPYNEYFNTLRCIGKGAFGFVNLAERKSNKEQVVVKFIRREKVLKDSWIVDPDMGRIPYEVYLLSKLKHPNIVKMLEAYENDIFIQVVMEKHGEGIDLFEFIDRKPSMDEALASYMFRQVLSATEYLHKNFVLHRDIKDENIIVDKQFNLKLIDFGSAAPMEKGKLFNTFCGTMEYCSPEVLLGNWYEGPELEMWSLGVTLYTFVFGEHPFFEVEETIRAELFPPFKVSNELMFAICWMLHPDVQFRAKLSDIITYPWFTRQVDITKYDYEQVLSGGDNISSGSTTPAPAGPVADVFSPQKFPSKSSKEERPSLTVSSIDSDNSSSFSSSSSESDVTSADSELERNHELMKEEYRKYLKDLKDVRTNAVLSNSF